MKLPKLGLWFWRRLISWFIVLAVHFIIGWIVWASPGAGYLGNVALGLIFEAVIVYSVYFGGSTFERFIQLASNVAGGIKLGWGGLSTLPAMPTTTTTTTAPNVSTTTTTPANAATVDPKARVEQDPDK